MTVAARTMLPPRPREAELLREATRLFRERGFHATSMQDLAERLGMNRGSLYHLHRVEGRSALVDRQRCPGSSLLAAGRSRQWLNAVPGGTRSGPRFSAPRVRGQT